MGKKFFDFYDKEDNYSITVEASHIESILQRDGVGIIGLKDENGKTTAVKVDLTKEKYEEISKYLKNI